jgi:hypothetical protein
MPDNTVIRNIGVIATLCLASVANAQTIHCSNPKDAEETRLCRESGMLPQPKPAINPYDEIERKAQADALRARMQETWESVATIYFATGCGVLPGGVEGNLGAERMVGALARPFNKLPNSEFGELWAGIKKYAEIGLAKAKEPQACDYWKDPQRVMTIRELARAAIMH